MKKDLISVIVPVYNVEKYLEISLNSLVNQTYLDLEIILVNDGSSDRSLDICQAFEKKDGRIKTFSIENQGQSYARNYGLNQASGDYILFMDADDYYAIDGIEYLNYLQEKWEGEIVLSNIISMKNRPLGQFPKIVDFDEGRLVPFEEALEKIYYGCYSGISPVAKLYKKDYLLKYPFPVGRIHEDFASCMNHLYAAKDGIVLGERATYYYASNPQGTSSSLKAGRLEYYFEAVKDNKDFLNQYFPKHQRLEAGLRYMEVIGGLRIYDLLIKSEDLGYQKAIVAFRKQIRVFWKDILKNSHISLREKIKYFVFITHIGLYKQLLR